MTWSTGSASSSTRASSGSTRGAGEPRFAMLETIREYAAEMLAGAGRGRGDRRPPRRGDARARRAGGAGAGRARTSAPGSTGSSASTTTCGPPSTGRPPSPSPRSRPGLAFALWRFWQQRGYLNEARARFERDGGARAGRSSRSTGRASPRRIGGIAYWQSDQPTADALVRRGARGSGARSATSARSRTPCTTAPTPT